MDEQKKETKELEVKRAIVSLPGNAIEINITCKLLDEHNKPYSVSAEMSVHDTHDAFRRADDGYLFDEDEPHAILTCKGDAFALVYLPEGAVYAHFECTCINWSGDEEKIERTLSMVDIMRAFKYAENDYIDEDDTFELTDKGREAMESLLGGIEG